MLNVLISHILSIHVSSSRRVTQRTHSVVIIEHIILLYIWDIHTRAGDITKALRSDDISCTLNTQKDAGCRTRKIPSSREGGWLGGCVLFLFRLRVCLGTYELSAFALDHVFMR